MGQVTTHSITNDYLHRGGEEAAKLTAAKAFERYYKRWLATLSRWCGTSFGYAVDAWDAAREAVQEMGVALVRTLLREQQRFLSGEHILKWGVVVGRRSLCDALTRRCREKKALREKAALAEATCPPPDVVASEKELWMRCLAFSLAIEAELKQLEEPARSIVQRRLDGASLRDVYGDFPVWPTPYEIRKVIFQFQELASIRSFTAELGPDLGEAERRWSGAWRRVPLSDRARRLLNHPIKEPS